MLLQQSGVGQMLTLLRNEAGRRWTSNAALTVSLAARLEVVALIADRSEEQLAVTVEQRFLQWIGHPSVRRIER